MLASCELALKQPGRAGGCTLEVAYPRLKAIPHPASSRGEFTAVSRRNFCPK
jgi:hypothetical protein